jgi:hypothetical protein
MARFKFRVTYRVRERGKAEGRTIEFRYEKFATAKSNYKAILLEFYLKRAPMSYEICLNRAGEPLWHDPIFHDMDGWD